MLYLYPDACPQTVLNTECINSEGKLSWHLGDGVNPTYLTGPEQPHFWEGVPVGQVWGMWGVRWRVRVPVAFYN